MSSSRVRALSWIPLLMLLLAATWWRDWTAGEELLLQRRYREAAQALAAGYEAAPVAQKDRVLFLLGQAQLLAGEPAAAIAAFDRLRREHAGSALVHQARFGAARAEERAGNLRAAAQIHRDEVERLVGLERKEEVAAVYLGLADQALAQEPPDPARAVTFHDLALDLGLSPGRARAVRLKAAEAQIAAGLLAPAVARLQPLLDELDAANGKLRAMLALGRARRQLGEPVAARAVLRDLRQLAPGSEEAADATWEIALSHGAPAPATTLDLERALAALRELGTAYPAHARAKVATFVGAQCLAARGRSDDALAALREFVAAQGDSGLPELAAARAMIGDVLLAQRRHEPALAAFREYLRLHPAHGEWERVQRAIVDTEYAMAEQAYRQGKAGFAQARARWLAFEQAWPLDPRNAGILFLFGDMLAQEERWAEAEQAWSRCVGKYPDRDESSRAQFEIGQLHELRVFHYESALAAYRKVTWGSHVPQAKERIQRLTRKSLQLRTGRVFTTAEPAVFELTSRNIESVRVRVYRLDLEDWFRATHTAGDVDRLDIEVIEADRTFASGIADYVRHRETTRAVPIGFDRPGAYVVKVDDQELEATTMVLISDLAMISKVSRSECFVFTQDVRQACAQGGVRVVLSDGQKVVAEGVTAPDGVWRWQGKELAQLDSLRVFAVDARGSGASSAELSGLGLASGLQPRGYLFTDRPLYQPGQRVFVKGIVREVKDGLYQLPATVGYRLQVSDPGGRLVQQRAVTFTAFGSFATEIDLPADADLGDWRIGVSVAGRDDLVFVTSVPVARYERPRLQLRVDLDRPVVFRGEPIQGRVVASWFHGEPAAARAVTLTMPLPDGAIVERTGQTDAAGELAFELPTTGFTEEAMVRLAARIPGENAALDLVVPVVTTEFVPTASTVREVYLAGESFDVELRVADRSGHPLARQLDAVLLRLQPGDGKAAPRDTVVEVEVARKPAATDGEGRGKVAFAVEQGGAYRVRVEAVDRFGTRVSGVAHVTISGDDDEVKLRLLCDRDRFRVGETAAVRVVNRVGARLLLLTWQGDGILHHEVRMLAAGESSLALPIEARLAPNFALALAMIDGNRLHTAEREFLVARDLRLAVNVPATARPGAEVEVAVTAADPQGNPVAAEVAVALVDAALLAVRADATAPIAAFFYGQRRETEFRTASSCTWGYQASSRPVSGDLLAEEGRATAVDRVVRRFADVQDGEGPPAPQPDVRAGGALQQSQNRSDAGDPRAAQDEFFLGGKLAAERGAFYVEGQSTVAGASGLELRFGFAGRGHGGIQARTDFRETGGWIGALVTGADGRGTARLVLPHSTTRWHVQARGVTVDTFVGEASAALRTQQDLQIDVAIPPVVTEGDLGRAIVRVHNLGGTPVEGRGSWQVSGGADAAGEFDLQLAARGEQVFEVPFAAAKAQPITLAVAAEAGGHSDAVTRTAVVLPFGVERHVGRAGSTRDQAAFELSLPAGRDWSAVQMLIEIGPDPGRDLLAAALGSGYAPANCRQVEITNLARASRGLAALAVLDYLERTGGGTAADTTRLLDVVRAVLAPLVGSQLQDGSLAWIQRGAGDVRTTCQVARLLAAARRRGMSVAEQPLQRVADWLQQQLRVAVPERRPDVLWALAEVDGARFEALNALHRTRNGLEPDGLARLALAWHANQRSELAAEVATTLRGKMSAATLGRLSVEAVALAGRALLLADRRDALGAAAVAHVRQARVGATFGTPEATAAALALLGHVHAEGAGAPAVAEVTVQVNGRALASVPGSAQGLSTAFVVPGDWLRPQGNQVRIAASGGGEVFFAANLVGFAREVQDEDRNRRLGEVAREYLALPPRHDGQAVPTGFGSVTGSRIDTFANTVTQLRVGESCLVRASFSIHGDDDRTAMAPLVLEEPIPAGCSVPPASIRGGFEHVQVQPDRLVFYFREATAAAVEYELQARFQGRYRVLPTSLQGAVRPDLQALGLAATLTVHAAGADARDPYRMTPDELSWRGRTSFEQAERLVGEPRRRHLQAADELLSQLLREWQQRDCVLRDDVHREVVRMLLFSSIERGDARAVVRFFEEIKDRHADLVIPFDKIVAVGRSYLDLGEFEAALLVFAATAEASFVKEAGVAATLESLGEVAASTRFLEQLLLGYPDLPTMRIARYSIGQRLAAVAAGLDPSAPVDERIGSAAQLRARSLATFREFLLLHGDDPLAEEVAFAWATTCLEGKDVATALAVCERALATYPQSPFTDEFLYTQGYAQFTLGRHDDAFGALQRVASEEFPRPHGGSGASESRWHAVYLQGQVHHARGEPAKALLAYAQVEDRFTDAGEAADYFRRQELALPEVVTLALDQPTEVTLTHRNVTKATLQVFRVDLMRLYLLEKSLDDIRGIQLHGIAPQLQLALDLGDGRDYRTIERKVALDLKQPGAYLVVATGDGLAASGMVLRSDLRLEVQEQFDAGRIRVNVKRGGAFLADAHVKVVGTGDRRFRSGDTDLRGIFVAEDLVGAATVIVKKDDQYAFFRGTGVHQAGRLDAGRGVRGPTTGGPTQPTGGGQRPGAQQFDALQEQSLQNAGNRARQVEWFKDNVLEKKQQGVQVDKTK